MTDPKIHVLTYDRPHRKTQDVLFGLKARGYQNVVAVGQPFQEREKPFTPLIPHRPSSCIDITPGEFCKNLGYEYVPAGEAMDSMRGELVLIAGSGILPPDFVERNVVINSHPAYLPHNRGLDALKWAIWNGTPTGVTTHKAAAEADAGVLIKQQMLSPTLRDSFHTFATRMYETEIGLLAESVEDTRGMDFSRQQVLEAHGKPNRRMPHHMEMYLLDKFEKFKLANAAQ